MARELKNLDELCFINSAENHHFGTHFIHIFKARFPSIKTNIKIKITLQIKLKKRGRKTQNRAPMTHHSLGLVTHINFEA